jgi:hypothetical protein
VAVDTPRPAGARRDIVAGLRRRLQRWLPPPDRLRDTPSLRWLGSLIERPWLWQLSRRRVAAGAAIGVFFAFVLPIAQIALAAGGAILARANLPVAAAATLITNPLTFAPIYLAAYRTGAAVLGTPVDERAAAAIGDEPDEPASLGRRLAALGLPWLVGMAVFAVCGAGIAWAGVHVAWIAAVRWRRWRRLRLRSPPD